MISITQRFLNDNLRIKCTQWQNQHMYSIWQWTNETNDSNDKKQTKQMIITIIATWTKWHSNDVEPKKQMILIKTEQTITCE